MRRTYLQLFNVGKTCDLWSPALHHYCTVPESSSRSGLQVGVTHTLRKRFTREEVLTFLTCTGDSNPLHVDAAAAAAAGFPAPLLPGILLASLFPAIIGSRFPGALYAQQSLNFRAPALVGSEVEACVTVSRSSGSRVTFTTTCTGPGGETLVDGSALALIRPSGPA
mmetsp:Transcript_14601/g.31835  ORF Transcript_14601/g.31835 Transcript_14601/m.31835 type:complete len:167 (+) Transcript_14601:116-616(+)